MKVQANNAPAGAFLVEHHPQKPGFWLVRFFENARQTEREEGWEYDEYTIVVPETPGLVSDIENNYEHWLETAKSLDMEHNALQSAQREVEGVLCDMAEQIVNLEIQNAFLEMGVNFNDL